MSDASDSVYAYFCVSDFDSEIEDITEIMGLAPTQSRRKGDPGKYRSSVPDGRWQLHSPLPTSELRLDKHIEAILPLLEERATAVVQLGDRYNTSLVCVGYYKTADPGFFLSKIILRRIAALNLSLDCDLYCRRED